MNQLITRGYQFKYDLRQLRSFLAVAEKLSFRKAAEDMYISQPALSRQIAQLESALGCQLFVRDKNTVALTTAGESLYQELPRIFQQLYSVTSSLTASRENLNRLRIGYACAAISSFFPSLIREIKNWLPEYEFEFYEMTTDKLIGEVEEGRIDGAFIMSRPREKHLKTVDIRSESIGLMVPDNHTLTAMNIIPLSALAKETLILFPRAINPTLYDQIIEHCEYAGFSPKAIKEAQSCHAAIGFVAAGAGVAFIASSMSGSCLRGTCFRPISPPGPVIDFSFISHISADDKWCYVFEKIINNYLAPSVYRSVLASDAALPSVSTSNQ